MRIYLGPFQWRERISSKTGLPSPAGVFGWRMPVGATQAIDFRGPQGGEVVNGFSPAKALFVCPDSVVLSSPYVQIASDPLESLSVQQRNRMRNVFEVSTSSAGRFLPLLHELACGHSDLSRTIKCPPRIAERSGRISWTLGGQVFHAPTPSIGSPEWAGLVARHRQIFRELKATGVTNLHRKYLWTLMRKYRLTDSEAVDQFTPPELVKESPVEPTTTLTESFTGTSDTFGGDQTWTEVSGDWDNNTNEGSLTTLNSTSHARCEGTLSTDDMRAQVTITAEGTNPFGGACVRFAAAATTHYGHNSNRGQNDYYCTRYSAGSGTDIITSELAGSIGLPTTDKIEVDGDQVEIFAGLSTSRGSTTDTNISGNVRGGVAWYQGFLAVGRFDNWQAEDLAAGTVQMFLLTPIRLDGIGHGGIFLGGRIQ